MKIAIEADPKEIADLVLSLQGQQNKVIKLMASKVFSKFCDCFDLHDEESDGLLERTACDGQSQTELSDQTINSLIRKAQNGDIKSLKKLKTILGD